MICKYGTFKKLCINLTDFQASVCVCVCISMFELDFEWRNNAIVFIVYEIKILN